MVEAKVKLFDGKTFTVRARSFQGIARKLEKIDGVKTFTAKSVKDQEHKERRDPAHVLLNTDFYPFV